MARAGTDIGGRLEGMRSTGYHDPPHRLRGFGFGGGATLALSTTIGPYRVEREIARGGMGIVYLARDTRLDRTVALKSLSDEVASDPARLERFEREAKLLASLNHPNIGAIYDVVDDAGHRYLALEHIEGESLAQRLTRGALAIPDALAICLEIATGLEAAHEQGIIHRDLKPGNVMIGPGDQAKIVDFGLAKGSAASNSTPDPSHPSSPTITSPAISPGTLPGVILGTAPYLSPEQARGKPLDRRTDIWSWGCILYECLTGKTAFRGETISDTVAAILKQEPDWSALPDATPSHVRELLRRTLEKDARRRLRDIGDARLILEDTLPGGTGMREPRARVRPFATALAGLAIVAVLAAGVAGLKLGAIHALQARPHGLVNLSIPIPRGLKCLSYRITPDGRSVVIAAETRTESGSGEPRRQIYVRKLDGTAFVPVPGTEGARWFMVSPDSKQIFFKVWSEDFSRFSLTSLDGSTPPTTIPGLPRTDNGWAWPRQNTLIMSIDEQSYQLVSLPSGAKSKPKPMRPDAGMGSGYIPGGRGVFVVTNEYQTGGHEFGIGVLDLRTGQVKKLIDRAASPRYIPGYILFTRGTSLFAAPFDPNRLAVTGDPTVVLGGLVTLANGPGQLQSAYVMAAASDGTLLYSSGGGVDDRRIIIVDRSGTEQEWGGGHRAYSNEMVLSPDGKRIALPCVSDDGLSQIFVSPLDRPSLRQGVAIQGADCEFPTWSPDGTELAFLRTSKSGEDGIYVTPSTGAGVLRQVIPGRNLIPLAWVPGRSELLCGSIAGKGLLLVPLNHKGPPRELFTSETGLIDGVLSPSGARVAYVEQSESNSLTGELFVRDMRQDGTVGDPTQVSTGGAIEAKWSRDGGKVFYLTKGGAVMAATLLPGSPPRVASNVEVWGNSLDIAHMGAVLDDGRLIAVQSGEGEAEKTELKVLLNTVDELQLKRQKSH